MAAGFLRSVGGDRIEILSAGSEPVDAVNPVAVQAMAEIGIDISMEKPHLLQAADAERSDVVITMGCGDACPVFPGKRYEEWELEDPAGKTIEQVRPIRDEIERRVEQLIARLT
jgi:arsenate reductase